MSFQVRAFQNTAFSQGQGILDPIGQVDAADQVTTDLQYLLDAYHDVGTIDIAAQFETDAQLNQEDGADQVVRDSYDANAAYHDVGTTELAPLSEDFGCVSPVVLGGPRASQWAGTTAWTLDLPVTANAGDLILAFYTGTPNDLSLGTDFTEWAVNWPLGSAGGMAVGYKIAVGGELALNGSSLNPVSGCSLVYVIAANTYDFSRASISTFASATSTSADPPSLTIQRDKALWFSAITRVGAAATLPPTNFELLRGSTNSPIGNARVDTAAAFQDVATSDPGPWTLPASVAWQAVTVAIVGVCPPLPTITSPDDPTYGYDLDTDFSSQTDPLSDDAAAVVLDDIPFIEDYSAADDTDYADYSSQTDQLADDFADVPVEVEDYSTVDDTDYADYGAFVPILADDLPEDFVLGDGRGLDDQDFTDLSDYSDFVAALSEDPAQDGLLGIEDYSTVDDVDYADYSVSVAPLSDDLPEDFILGIEDYSWADDTDYTDYSVQTDPLSDDAVAVDYPPFIEDYSTTDDTDYTDYSGQTDPLSDDFPEDFQLGVGTAVDDQDFTDYADYSSQVDQLSEDIADSVAILEDYSTVDDTDYADYSGQVDPLADDFPEDFILGDGKGLDDQDFTDLVDYSSQVDPLSDDLPQDFALGDGKGLDDQDFTDLADYSDAINPLSDDLPENFILGVEDYRNVDDADYADYSSSFEPLPDDFVAPQDFIIPAEDYSNVDDVDYADYSSFTPPLSDSNLATLTATASITMPLLAVTATGLYGIATLNKKRILPPRKHASLVSSKQKLPTDSLAMMQSVNDALTGTTTQKMVSGAMSNVSQISLGGLQVYVGSGVPQFAAEPGSMYLNISGGAGGTMYVKESLAKSTVWVAK
jgi:hypothetical protein